jgi:hypothetical protein
MGLTRLLSFLVVQSPRAPEEVLGDTRKPPKVQDATEPDHQDSLGGPTRAARAIGDSLVS